jgi:hypothetical protein
LLKLVHPVNLNGQEKVLTLLLGGASLLGGLRGGLFVGLCTGSLATLGGGGLGEGSFGGSRLGGRGLCGGGVGYGDLWNSDLGNGNLAGDGFGGGLGGGFGLGDPRCC